MLDFTNDELFVRVAYEPMKFRGLSENHEVMVAVGMSSDEVLAKLIDGYKP